MEVRQAMDNLKHTVEVPGLTMNDINQILIYVTAHEQLPVFNAVYVEYFTPPIPTGQP